VDELLILAPAKINLILQVIGKRTDGYHDVKTLIQQVSLYDEITISIGGRGIRVYCDNEEVPKDEGNIAWRAARLVLNRSKKEVGIRIIIKKGIPVASGLGGGSSDAAATIIGLNKLLDLRKSKEDLMEWGATLGADVPFFIFGSPALATGIGDKLKRVSFSFSPWYILISFPFKVSTEWAYSNLNLRLTKEGFWSNIPELFQNLEELTGLFKNDLESVTQKRYPEILNAKRELISRGAKGVLMSGSGPTIFGIFPDEPSARHAYKGITQDRGWEKFIVKGIFS
jgi:4-diphosphocytidyl-2-C-methyl-D-erythritol kinase